MSLMASDIMERVIGPWPGSSRLTVIPFSIMAISSSQRTWKEDDGQCLMSEDPLARIYSLKTPLKTFTRVT